MPGGAVGHDGVVTATPVTDWIDLDGAVNARAVVPRVLLRADNLQALSAADVRRLIDDHRLELVIDLRTDVEVVSEGPGPLTHVGGVRIEHRSLYPDSGGNTDLEVDTVRSWGAALDGEFAAETPVVRAYLSYLRRRPDSIVAAVRSIARADGAVLVHCAAGKDRTGVVVALALAAAGVADELIVGDYLLSAERIEAIMARLISSPTYRAELEAHDPRDHAPRVGTMERVLEIVHEQAGSAAAWLADHGLADEDVLRLRRRLRT